MFVSRAAKACTARLSSQSRESAHFCRNLRDRVILPAEPTLAAPFYGGRMARREYQAGKVRLEEEAPRPYWYFRCRIWALVGKNQKKRKHKRFWLGYKDEMGKREAELLRDEIMGEINGQVYVMPSLIPFTDFVRVYREKHFPTLSPWVQAKYDSLLRNHILPAFAGKALSDVDSEAIQEFLNDKKREGLSWFTRSDLRNLLSGIFTKAKGWHRYKGENPVAGADLDRKNWKHERRLLRDKEFLHLLSNLMAVFQLMVMILVSTGMRITELLGLRWRSVDLEKGSISVVERHYRGDAAQPKSDPSVRELPLGRLVAALGSYKPVDAGPEDYVFQRDGRPLDDRVILRNFLRPAAECTGLYWHGFGWRSFRRQNITEIQDSVAEEAQDQAGHASSNMTRVYVISRFERRKRLVLRLQRRLLKEGWDWTPDRGFAGILRET
jgi:integrase